MLKAGVASLYSSSELSLSYPVQREDSSQMNSAFLESRVLGRRKQERRLHASRSKRVVPSESLSGPAILKVGVTSLYSPSLELSLSYPARHDESSWKRSGLRVD